MILLINNSIYSDQVLSSIMDFRHYVTLSVPCSEYSFKKNVTGYKSLIFERSIIPVYYYGPSSIGDKPNFNILFNKQERKYYASWRGALVVSDLLNSSDVGITKIGRDETAGWANNGSHTFTLSAGKNYLFQINLFKIGYNKLSIMGIYWDDTHPEATVTYSPKLFTFPGPQNPPKINYDPIIVGIELADGTIENKLVYYTPLEFQAPTESWKDYSDSNRNKGVGVDWDSRAWTTINVDDIPTIQLEKENTYNHIIEGQNEVILWAADLIENGGDLYTGDFYLDLTPPNVTDTISTYLRDSGLEISWQEIKDTYTNVEDLVLTFKEIRNGVIDPLTDEPLISDTFTLANIDPALISSDDRSTITIPYTFFKQDRDKDNNPVYSYTVEITATDSVGYSATTSPKLIDLHSMAVDNSFFKETLDPLTHSQLLTSRENVPTYYHYTRFNKNLAYFNKMNNFSVIFAKSDNPDIPVYTINPYNDFADITENWSVITDPSGNIGYWRLVNISADPENPIIQIECIIQFLGPDFAHYNLSQTGYDNYIKYDVEYAPASFPPTELASIILDKDPAPIGSDLMYNLYPETFPNNPGDFSFYFTDGTNNSTPVNLSSSQGIYPLNPNGIADTFITSDYTSMNISGFDFDNEFILDYESDKVEDLTLWLDPVDESSTGGSGRFSIPLTGDDSKASFDSVTGSINFPLITYDGNGDPIVWAGEGEYKANFEWKESWTFPEVEKTADSLISEEFSLVIDNSPPIVSSNKLDLRYVNNNIPILELTLASGEGTAENPYLGDWSGISKVEIAIADKDSPNINFVDIENSETGIPGLLDGLEGKQIKFSDPSNTNSPVIQYPLLLSNNSGLTKRVSDYNCSVRITDGAGNISIIDFEVRFDNIPPTFTDFDYDDESNYTLYANGISYYTSAGNNKKITGIKFEADSIYSNLAGDPETVSYAFVLENNEAATPAGISYGGYTYTEKTEGVLYVSLDTAEEFPANQLLPVSLLISDLADNQIAPIISLHTPAQINPREITAESFISKDTIAIDINNSNSEASSVWVEAIRNDISSNNGQWIFTPNTPSIEEEMNLGTGQTAINLPGLLPHHYYQISLTPINNNRKKNNINIVSALDAPLPDRKPFEPTFLSPQQYIKTATPEFIWVYENENSVFDADDDTVESQLFINGVLASGSTAISSSTVSFILPQELENMNDGTVYNWEFVMTPVSDLTSDHEAYLASIIPDYWKTTTASGSMIVDTTAPVIKIQTASIEQNSITYSSDKILQFSVADQFTIKDITVVHISQNVRTTLYPLQPQDYTNRNAENITIPLLQGEGVFEFTAVDYADNKEIIITSNKIIDFDRPLISNLDIGNDQPGSVLYYRDALRFSVTTDDNLAGISGVELSVNSEAGLLLQSKFYPVSQKSSNLADVIVDGSFTADGLSGQLLQLSFTAFDYSGNSSVSRQLSKTVLFDKSGPENVSITLIDAVLANGVYYYSDTAEINAAVSADDEQSGVTLFYRFKNSGLPWSTELDTAISSAVFIDGSDYQLELKAVNGVGKPEIAESQTFRFDKSIPDFDANAITFESGSLEFTSGTVVRVTVKASDPDSDIKSLKFALGTGSGQNFEPEVTKTVTVDGWLESTGSNEASHTFILPENLSGSYTAVLFAENYAGLTGKADEIVINVTPVPENIVLFHPEEYTNTVLTISGSWLYMGIREPVSYKYNIEISEANSVVRTISGTGINPSFTEVLSAVDELLNGQTYRYQITALFENSDDLVSEWSYTASVDTLSPVFDSSVMSVPFYNNPDNLSVQYAVSDNISGLGEVSLQLYTIITDTNGAPVLDDKNNVQFRPIADSFRIPAKESGTYPISLKSVLLENTVKLQQIFVGYRVIDRAGNTADWMSSPINIDYTNPPKPQVHDSGDFFSTTRLNDLFFAWNTPNGDPESGITSYLYKWITENEVISDDNWIELVDSNINIYKQLPIPSGVNSRDTLYLAVKAANGAGMESEIGISNGITNDATQAIITDITITTGGQDNIFYINNLNEVGTAFTVYEGESLITDGYACFGSYDSATGEFQPLTNELPFIFIDSAEKNQSFSFNYNLDSLLGSNTVNDGDAIYYQIYIKNSAGLTSLTTSRAVMYDSQVPELSNIYGYASADTLHYSWNVSSHYAPISRFEISLTDIYGNGGNYSAEINDPASRNVSVSAIDPLVNLGGGIYPLEISAWSISNSWSSGLSNAVVYDDTAPIIVPESFITKPFASERVRFKAEFQEDPYGRITDYLYCVGTALDDDLISDGWIHVSDVGNELYKDLSLTNLPNGLSNLIDGSTLYIRVQARNAAGLWSDFYQSKSILVDKSIPVIESLTFDFSPNVDFDSRFDDLVNSNNAVVIDLSNFYVNNSTSIDRTNLDANDYQSGLERIEYRLVGENGSSEWMKYQWGYNESIVDYIFTNELEITDLALVDKNIYTLDIRTMNGAGDYSLISSTGSIIVDLTNPEIEYTFTPTEGNYITDSAERYIINTNPLSNGQFLPVRFKVNEDTSEKVFVTLEIQNTQNQMILKLLEQEIFPDSNGVWQEFSFDFDEPDANGQYGDYILIAKVTDAAGRFTNYAPNDQLKPILRMNDPPSENAALAYYLTTPGAVPVITPSYKEDGEDILLYVDNDLISRYDWTIVDVTADFNPTSAKQDFINYINNPDAVSIVIHTGTGYELTNMAYFHRGGDINRAFTDYGVIVVVTDTYGKQATFYNVLKVVNTSSGPLYTDEVWSTDLNGLSHQLTGLVSVGTDLSLEIAEGSTVQVMITPDDEEFSTMNKGLDIYGSLTVNEGVSFVMQGNNQKYVWKGILVYGIADFNASQSSKIKINLAERGITVGSESTVSTLEHIEFFNNEIGIHVLDVGLTIDSCYFIGSLGYAIKEDNNADPMVTNNIFIDNSYDYYNTNWFGTSRTLYTFEELNTHLGLSSINRNEGTE